MTEKIIDKLQSIADGVFSKESTAEHSEKEAVSTEEQTEEVTMPNEVHTEEEQQNDASVENTSVEKIVLRGNHDVQNESKE